jgi:hypothetical protein
MVIRTRGSACASSAPDSRGFGAVVLAESDFGCSVGAGYMACSHRPSLHLAPLGKIFQHQVLDNSNANRLIVLSKANCFCATASISCNADKLNKYSLLRVE